MCQKTKVFVLATTSGFPGPQISQIGHETGQAWALGVGVRCWLLMIYQDSESVDKHVTEFAYVIRAAQKEWRS